MKTRFIIVCTICVLFLSACGSVLQSAAPASSVASHTTTTISTANTKTICHVLQDRQTLLKRGYQVATVQLAAAQAHGNLQQEGAAEKTLMRLHLSIAQTQKQLKVC